MAITIEPIQGSNEYLHNPVGTSFNNICSQITTRNLTFIFGSQGYPPKPITATSDLFETLSATQILAIQNDADTYFLYNAELEGWGVTIYFDAIYYNCKKYNISPSKIIFVTANMDVINLTHKYNKLCNIQKSINVFPFMSFKLFVYQTFRAEFQNRIVPPTNEVLATYKKRVNDEYTGKYFLSLSRRPRLHRNLLQFLLSYNTLHHKGIISQNKLTVNEYGGMVYFFNYSIGHLEEWNKTLPIIADTTDFETNHADNMNMSLQLSTIFQIISETYSEIGQEADMFFSEKTFKPMALMQPFMIAGQPFCNTRLEEYGFKLYHNLFDYSFDKIIDTKTRFTKIYQEVIRVTKLLDKMSREEQIEWRFKESDILTHNFNLLIDTQREINDLTQFIEGLN